MCKTCPSKILNGVVGVTKSVTGIDIAAENVIEERRAICRECPSAKPCNNPKNRGKVCKCTECGCILKHKTRLADQKCPLGKWDVQ